MAIVLSYSYWLPDIHSVISLCHLPGILHLRCVDWNRLSLILKPFPPPGSPEFPRLLGECLPWQELRKGLRVVWRHSFCLLARADRATHAVGALLLLMVWNRGGLAQGYSSLNRSSFPTVALLYTLGEPGQGCGTAPGAALADIQSLRHLGNSSRTRGGGQGEHHWATMASLLVLLAGLGTCGMFSVMDSVFFV